MKFSLSRRSFSIVRRLLLGLALAALPQITRADAPAPYSCDFESPKLPAGWKTEGSVTLDSSAPFEGKQSLLFTRTKADAEKPCSATGPDFKVIPGIWDIKGGVKPDLYSPDSSFEAVVFLDLLDASGKVLDEKTVSNVFGQNGWNPFDSQVEISKNAVAARFRAELHKTYGHYWLDALSATYVGEAPHKVIDRLVFSTVALGNLLYPTDSRVVSLRAETLEELPANERVVHFGVRDYWGAEQMKPVDVALTPSDKKGDDGRLVYEGSIDLAQANLEQGRYYEMYGEIPQKDKPFRNYSGVAIEPESVNNAYPPQDVPFSGRNWDGRIPEGFDLSHRIGIRIMNIWSGWESTAPYTPHAPRIELCEKYNMGVIFGTPDGEIERKVPGEKYDEKALHDGIINLLNTYGKKVPAVYVSLGNEPPVLPDRIAADVKAYKAVYEGAKEANPNAFVISTSVGPAEEFFKGGFGKYCDAYDFHIYEDPANVALTVKKYQAMFKLYGNAKPIWSTEVGLNSQGVARYTVSIDMVKKFALFFASGGANMSWFDLFYPDKNGTIADSNGASFDVFDSRYVKYNPKITAVTYYDMLNAISIKKFIGEKTYGDDLHAFLFRDKNNDELEILWKDKGRQDVFVPLADVDKAESIRLDGSHRPFAPQGKGITLTVSEEPVLLLYKGTAPLADKLGDPAATLADVPASIVRGGSMNVNVAVRHVIPADVSLVVPPFWKVETIPVPANATQDEASIVHFKVTAPALSQVREADMTVRLGDGKGNTVGELYLRPKVTAQISTALVPVPPAEGGEPAVKMTLTNNGAQKQDVNWSLSMVEENALVNGAYDTHRPTKVHFKGDTQGKLSLDPGASQDVTLSLEGTDPLIVYRVRAVVTDSLGETAVRERNVAGFVSVPKVTAPLKLDGVLDEADWKRAPVEKIDQERQYYSFDKVNVKWKGPKDLSGAIRYLWDDKYLYVGVEVTDDKQGAIKEDGMLWDMDGLQFLVDPCRNMEENVGKYDYAMAIGKKGPQAWCSLTADAGAPNGEAKDIVVSYQRHDEKTGNITYELAIPWYRLAPFKPGAGNDLGLTMILNEDDGTGRKSFMTWFGNAHSKQVDGVADLILAP